MQKLVAFFEMPAPEKPVESRKGAGVHCFQHEMPVRCYERFFASGVAAPEHENHRLGLVAQRLYHAVGKDFPPFAFVAVGFSAAHGERRVEQQHALFRPADEAAVFAEMGAVFGVDFFEYVDQAGRRLNAGLHGKRQTVRLTFAVIGVLTQNDNFDVVVIGCFQRGKDPLFGRINRVFGVFFFEKFAQIPEIRFAEFLADDFIPAVFESVHKLS